MVNGVDSVLALCCGSAGYIVRLICIVKPLLDSVIAGHNDTTFRDTPKKSLKSHTIVPSEPATFVQRLPNVFQTFETRWVVVLQTSPVHRVLTDQQ